MLQIGLTIGRPIFGKKFLKDRKGSDLLICTLSLSHYQMAYEKYKYLKTFALKLLQRLQLIDDSLKR